MKTKTVTETDISRFHGDVEWNKDGSMSGTYDLGSGIIAKYSVSKQKSIAHYGVRGTVSLLNPETGAVLKVKVRGNTAKGREKDRSSAMDTDGSEARMMDDPGEGKKKLIIKDARLSIQLNSYDPEVIRKTIAVKARNLYNQNVLQILESAEKAVPVSEMSFALAVSVFKPAYLQERSKSESMRHSYDLRLTKVCDLLSPKPVSKLSLNMVKELCEKIGTNWREYIQVAESLLNFAFRTKRDSDNYNVFAEYLKRNPTEDKKNALYLQRVAANSDILSTDEERALNQKILFGIENGVLIGVTLVKEACFSASTACELMWSDVILVENSSNALRIRYRRDEIAGATHDYSFPLVGFGAEVLRRRRAWLQEQGLSETKISKMYVASDEEDPKVKLKSKILTESCRNILRNAGVGYAVLAGLKEYQKGAGITLLHQSYRYRLETVCGLKEDQAIVRFMMHESLVNMLQANHYRCLTDETAWDYLLTALERDKRFEDEVKPARTIKRQRIDSGERITALAENSKRRNRATFRMRLKPGETAKVYAAHGCHVEIRTAKITK